MCAPVALFALTAGLAVIGGIQQIQASKAVAKVDQQVTSVNVKAAEAQAVDAERLGQQEANERRLKTRLQLAEQRVGFAAQNVEATGTALDILGDTAMFGEIDEQRIRANAQRKAWGYRMQGWNYAQQGALNQYQAKVDQRGTILSTAGGVLNAYTGSGLGSGGGGGSTSSTSSSKSWVGPRY